MRFGEVGMIFLCTFQMCGPCVIAMYHNQWFLDVVSASPQFFSIAPGRNGTPFVIGAVFREKGRGSFQHTCSSELSGGSQGCSHAITSLFFLLFILLIAIALVSGQVVTTNFE